jgi:hypothetical protein
MPVFGPRVPIYAGGIVVNSVKKMIMSEESRRLRPKPSVPSIPVGILSIHQ